MKLTKKINDPWGGDGSRGFRVIKANRHRLYSTGENIHYNCQIPLVEYYAGEIEEDYYPEPRDDIYASRMMPRFYDLPKIHINWESYVSASIFWTTIRDLIQDLIQRLDIERLASWHGDACFLVVDQNGVIIDAEKITKVLKDTYGYDLLPCFVNPTEGKKRKDPGLYPKKSIYDEDVLYDDRRYETQFINQQYREPAPTPKKSKEDIPTMFSGPPPGTTGVKTQAQRPPPLDPPAAKPVAKPTPPATPIATTKEPKKETNTMSNTPATTSKSTISSALADLSGDVVTTLKSDTEDALVRLACRKSVRLTKKGILKLLKGKGVTAPALASARNFLDTEDGDTFVGFLIGAGIPVVPQLNSNPTALRAAKEFRVEAISRGADSFFTLLMNAIVPDLLTVFNEVEIPGVEKKSTSSRTAKNADEKLQCKQP